MSKSMLKIDNLTTGYGQRQVLHNLSLSVTEGSVVGITGPNGHGKTTLLRAISGLVPAWSGQIFLNGTAIQEMPAYTRVNQGLVHIPQGDLIFPDMTIEENLILGGYLAPSGDELNLRLETVYDFFPRLFERSSQQARTLSGGERRMLGIGRGLMTSGEIMMLDEPSLGLAPKIIDHIYEVIAGLRTSSPTLLIVEENPTRLQSVADWIYLMDDGAFVWNGSADELKESSDLLNTYLGA
jgi:branched-chain amino acid transport system ATP-binding protein